MLVSASRTSASAGAGPRPVGISAGLSSLIVVYTTDQGE